MRLCITLVLCIAFAAANATAQEMVISEYFNIQTVENEWTELVVVKDDLNAVGWFVTDANTNQVTRQGGPRFNDVPLWRHLRAGTIIVLWHRAMPVTATLDTNAADGYLEMSSRDPRFFTTLYFAPPSDAADMNIADAGDVLTIMRADSSHVHSLGHNKPTGDAYNDRPSPKVNFDSGAVGAGRSNRVTGRSLAAYGAGITKDSAVGGFNDSRGLPNRFDLARTNAGVPNINHWFWRETREPQWSGSPAITLVSRTATKHTIEWTPLIDTYQADSTTGYVIVRDTLGFSTVTTPLFRDGSIVQRGQRIGSALVLDVRPTGRGNNRHVDSINLVCGQSYTYRVYGYRYSADEQLSTTDDTTARGRQYTELRYAQSAAISKPNPSQPIIQASRTQFCNGDTVSLTTTAIADRYDWTVNGVPVPVGGTTRIVVREPGVYRLTVSADGGCSSTSDPVTITLLPAVDVDIQPRGTQQICTGDSVVLTAGTSGTQYEWLRDGNLIAGATGQSYTARTAGDYQVRIPTTQGGCPGISASVRVRLTDVRIRFASASLDFGSLGQCTSDTTVGVELINDGSVDVTITNTNFPPAFALASPPPGFVIRAGSRQLVRIIFTPAASGLTQGTATFVGAPCNATASIALRGTRTQVSAALDRASVDFGTYSACPLTVIRPDSTFLITNSGTAPIMVQVPRVDPPFFLLTDFPGPQQVNPGGSLPIQIQYRPLGADRNRGVVQQVKFPFTSQVCSDTLRAQLVAATFTPAFDLENTQIDIGTVLHCSNVVDTVIVVRNTSSVPVTINGVTGTGVTAIGLPTVVDPNSSKVVSVRCTVPTVAGPFAISASVDGDPCSLRSDVVFAGTVEVPKYNPAQTSVDFGTTSLCGPQPPIRRDVVVVRTSSMNMPSAVQSVVMPAPFTTSLTPGTVFTDTLRFTVQYTPSVVGAFNVDLVLTLGPCNDVLTIPCSAVATSSTRTTTISATNFGVLTPGQRVQQTVTIVNTGSSPLSVNQIAGIQPPFAIVNSVPVLPTTLSPGAIATVEIEYSFAGYDRRDTVTILSTTSGACADTVRFRLTGATSSRGTVSGVVVRASRDAQAYAGQIAEMPLALTSPVALDTLDIRTVDVYVTYDATVAAVTGARSDRQGYTATASELRPGHAVIRVASATPIVAMDSIGIAQLRTYVSSTNATEVIVDSVQIPGVLANGTPGRVTVLADCAIEAQLVGTGRPVVLSVESQTGSELNLRYSTFLLVETSITVVDVTGRSVWHSNVTAGDGEYAHSIPTSALGNGTYVVVLRHGPYLRTVPLYLCR